MPRHTLKRAAKADLKNIWHYIAQHNVVAADKMLDRFEEHFVLLSEHPFIGAARDEYQSGLRILTHERYEIFYRVLDGHKVEIVRVVHGARLKEKLFPH